HHPCVHSFPTRRSSDLVDAVLRRVGPRIVLALPLGIGKPNPLVNEFYRRALRDSSIDLTIVTALSLLKPVARSALEARQLAPLADRKSTRLNSSHLGIS